MTKIHELGELGQSIWYDNIERTLINSGQLQALIGEGITGSPAVAGGIIVIGADDGRVYAFGG